MRGNSHRCLGTYLADHYMPQIQPWKRRIFLIGCVQPDKNPATYLKGSLRGQWLRGHNYHNALPYITRLARRLESRRMLRLVDYYSLGKLIHYITDAFTSAHNQSFPKSLRIHREYEARLQEYFLSFLAGKPNPPGSARGSVMERIRTCHRGYMHRPTHVGTDTRYAFAVCCMVMGILCP